MKSLVHTTLLIFILHFSASGLAQVTYQRLLHAEQEPENWLTYSGTYNGHRYSRLDQINRENVQNLKLKWVFQMRTLEKVETTPLVVDGIMYLTEPPSNAFALDPGTGRTYWSYVRNLPEVIKTCCGRVNRVLAILGDEQGAETANERFFHLEGKIPGAPDDENQESADENAPPGIGSP